MEEAGVMFDTRNCEVVGSVWDRYQKDGPRYRETTLFRRPTGGYFLCTCKGPLPGVAGSVSGGAFNASYRSVSEAHAREWAQLNLPVEDIEKAFPDMVRKGDHDGEPLTPGDRAVLLGNVRKARELADKPYVALVGFLDIPVPVTPRGRRHLMAFLDEAERYLKEEEELFKDAVEDA